MYRKFFYENSSFVGDLAIFAEITSPRIAEKYLGVTGTDQIVVL